MKKKAISYQKPSLIDIRAQLAEGDGACSVGSFDGCGPDGNSAANCTGDGISAHSGPFATCSADGISASGDCSGVGTSVS